MKNEDRCWYERFDFGRCSNLARWKSPDFLLENPGPLFRSAGYRSFIKDVRWCDEHKHDNDVPILEDE